MRVTLPSAAPSIGPEIGRMPSMTRLSQNGNRDAAILPADKWRGKTFLDPSEYRKRKAMGKRGRVWWSMWVWSPPPRKKGHF